MVKSTLAAECLALEEGAETAYLIRCILAEILDIDFHDIPIECIIDNKSLHESLYSTKTVDDKHLLVDIAILREQLATKDLTKIKWVESNMQLADCLTKKGASTDKLIHVLNSGSMNQ